MKEFGKLRLSAKNTTNGNGFDIFYEFDKGFDFCEFTSKKDFYFIQPWMQFPAREYTDECMLVSIELVNRFNEFPLLQERIKRLEKSVEELHTEARKMHEI